LIILNPIFTEQKVNMFETENAPKPPETLTTEQLNAYTDRVKTGGLNTAIEVAPCVTYGHALKGRV
jgi:hypothetical protein